MTFYNAFANDLSWVLPLRNETLTYFFTMFPHIVKFPVFITIILIGYYWFNPIFFRNLALLTVLSDFFNFALKNVFKIPRPAIDHLVSVGDHIYSFPSGDAQVAATFWLGLAFYFRNVYFTIFSSLLVFLIACSRVYIGVHYPRDVIIGILLGVSFLWFIFKFPKTEMGQRVTKHPSLQQGLIWFFLMALTVFVWHSFPEHHLTYKIGMTSGILIAMAFLSSEPTLFSEPLSARHAKIRLTTIGVVCAVSMMVITKYFLGYIDKHIVEIYPITSYLCHAFVQFAIFYLVPKFYFSYVRRVIVE